MGIFENNWLEIPATGKMAFLRYAEFTQVSKKDNKIMQTAMFIDIPHLMVRKKSVPQRRDSHFNPFFPFLGSSWLQPLPACHRCVSDHLYLPHDPHRSDDGISGLTTNSIFSAFFSKKKFLKKKIFPPGKSMTPHQGNAILFRTSQQLSRLRLEPLKGFLS